MRKTQRNMTRQAVSRCLLLLLLSYSLSPLADGLQAWLDRTQVGEGQSVQLHLIAPPGAAGEPELSALRKHFDIRNIEQGSQVQVLNGQPVNMRSWQLALSPKRPGRLTVPALRVGQATSAPLQLDVLPAGQVPVNRVLRDVMLQTDVSQLQPFVQGKVIYTLRLYTRLDLRKVHFSDPEVLGAIVERLGEDRKYNTYLGRYRYHVLQRRFVLFPQRSGRLSVISPLLNAEVREKKRQWPLQMRGPEITLDVQPQPDTTLHPWLPAESLSLSETWSPDPSRFQAGKPMNRSIVITAQGVSAAQLPDLPQTVPQGISLYPEQPVSSTRATDNTLITRKVLNHALVASREGNYRLPELSLTWWDVTTGTRKTEVLPARDIAVLPAAASDRREPQPADKDVYLAGVNLDAWWQSVDNAWQRLRPMWPWLTMLVLMAFLANLFFRWRGTRNRNAPTTPPSTPPVKPGQSGGNALHDFEHACQQNDPHRAREALLDWASATWSDDPPQGLDRLATRLGPQATDPLAGIDRALYAPKGDAWDGTGVLAVLQPLLRDAARNRGTRVDKSALPPLYNG